MAQLTDDCFAFGGKLMPVAEAVRRLTEVVTPVVEVELVALRQARDRVLAAEVVAPMSVPPHDNSAVDGYAVFFDDLAADRPTRLPIGGRAAAGHPLDRPARPGEAIRIFTGAPMPAGPDTVMMQEDCSVAADGPSSHVIISPGIKRGANRRRAGEDVKAGDTVLARGQRLRPQDIGLAAALGLTELAVYRALRIAVFSTGDEVREPGNKLPTGCIYDSNRITIAALLDGLGGKVTDLGILPDHPEVIADQLAKAAADHDAVVTSGGVSGGEEDHVKAAVERLGRLHFWRLAIKPGRPVALGQIGRVPFIGLPGNPVAVMVTFLGVARPLLLRLAGATQIHPRHFQVRAGFDYQKKAERREYVRARLAPGKDGIPIAHKFVRDGAGILSSMVQSDGLVELPEDLTRVTRGNLVDFLPFSEVRL
ncbi:MAG: molybdopterin molybdotransferase MoeA [Alphaproteobacteria bacterium]|nr:molybdopterin molybdotransferase MoeA [Alphaproteobacteria bacterium]